MTQTPPHYFFLRGEFPSGESIQSAEAGLVAKVEDKQVIFGEAWERVMRLAFAVQDDPRAGAEDCETIWRDPRLRPEGVVVDAASKKFAMGVPLRQLLEDMGYSPQQQAASWPRPTRRWRPPLAEHEALPDPTPAQLAEADRIDAGQIEGTSSTSGVVEGEATSTEGGTETFPREYVEQLRRENADRRKRAEELEGRNARLLAGLLRAEVVADGRLADPADLTRHHRRHRPAR